MFNAKKFVATKMDELRNRIESERIVAACSGGLNSRTAIYPGHKAFGRNVLAVFIDERPTASRMGRDCTAT